MKHPLSGAAAGEQQQGGASDSAASGINRGDTVALQQMTAVEEMQWCHRALGGSSRDSARGAASAVRACIGQLRGDSSDGFQRISVCSYVVAATAQGTADETAVKKMRRCHNWGAVAEEM